jgi:hypothetical protein
MNDPTNPTLGVQVSDPNYDASQLSVTATFTNTATNTISAVNLTGSDGSYTLAVTPGLEVGQSDVTITARRRTTTTTSIQVPYGLSPYYGNAGDRYYADAGNASTEISVGGGYFIAGDDLSNVLRLYNSAVSGPPVKSFDFTGDLPDGSTTIDIESAAEVDNGGTEDIYWLGSESNSSSGNPRPAADTVFETQVDGSGAVTRCRCVPPEQLPGCGSRGEAWRGCWRCGWRRCSCLVRACPRSLGCCHRWQGR